MSDARTSVNHSATAPPGRLVGPANWLSPSRAGRGIMTTASMLDEIRDYRRQRHSMVLATRLEDEVRAATTCFALDDALHLYFFVFRDSVKHRGILQSSQVAAAIDDGFTVPMR